MLNDDWKENWKNTNELGIFLIYTLYLQFLYCSRLYNEGIKFFNDLFVLKRGFLSKKSSTRLNKLHYLTSFHVILPTSNFTVKNYHTTNPIEYAQLETRYYDRLPLKWSHPRPKWKFVVNGIMDLTWINFALYYCNTSPGCLVRFCGRIVGLSFFQFLKYGFIWSFSVYVYW